MQPLTEIEALKAQKSWVRRLARRLVGDAAAAEDLEQDAWVAALAPRTPSKRPAAARSPRAFLAGILRNLARQERRARSRRIGRERRAARSEAQPSALDLVEEVATQREVADAVLALAEPYRTAILLRFYRELSLKGIAKRQGVPLSTVHSRIQRGLALLRERLDAGHGGDRRAWVLALLPFTERSGGLVLPLIGAVAVSTSVKLVAAAVAVVGAAVGLWMVVDRSPEGPSRAAYVPPVDEATVEELAPVSRGGAGPARAVADRAVLPAAGPAADVAAAPGVADRLRGRVVDESGLAVPDVAVRFHRYLSLGVGRDPKLLPSRDPIRTDGDGAFELDRPDAAGTLLVEDDYYTTLIPLSFSTVEEDSEALVVVGPRRPMAGWVVDGEGAPVAGAELALFPSADLFRSHGLTRVRRVLREGIRATSDEEGWFELPDACGGWTEVLAVHGHGYEHATPELPEHSKLDLRIVLSRTAEEDAIWGTVVDASEVPVPDAMVSLGGEITHTDEEGSFRLVWNEELLGAQWLDGTIRLTAVKSGFRPVRREVTEGVESPVVLRFEGPPLSITGRVMDGSGEPVGRAVVWADPTPFGLWSDPSSGELGSMFDVSAEEMLRGGWGKRGARADKEGFFELTGLMDRVYRLRAIDRTLALGEEQSVHAGSRGVELSIATEPTSRVAGRVVSLGGDPLPNVLVWLVREREGLDWMELPHMAKGPQVRTDAEGRFEFRRLALEGTKLIFYSERTVRNPDLALEDVEDPAAVEMVLPLRCEVQVDVSVDPGLADAFRVLDGDGELLELVATSGSGVWFVDDTRIDGGRSDVMGVSEEARTVVLLREGEEVRRIGVELVPGEVRVVRP